MISVLTLGTFFCNISVDRVRSGLLEEIFKMKLVLKVAVVLALVFGTFMLFAQDPMSQKAEDFVSAMSKGDFQKAYLSLSSDLGFKVKPENLQSVWNQLTSKAGKFVEFKESKAEFKNDFTLVVTVCKFEKGLVDLHIAVDSTGKIAGFQIKDHKGGAPQAAAKQSEEQNQQGG